MRRRLRTLWLVLRWRLRRPSPSADLRTVGEAMADEWAHRVTVPRAQLAQQDAAQVAVMQEALRRTIDNMLAAQAGVFPVVRFMGGVPEGLPEWLEENEDQEVVPANLRPDLPTYLRVLNRKLMVTPQGGVVWDTWPSDG
jgi:hypothetical protein